MTAGDNAREQLVRARPRRFTPKVCCTPCCCSPFPAILAADPQQTRALKVAHAIEIAPAWVKPRAEQIRGREEPPRDVVEKTKPEDPEAEGEDLESQRDPPSATVRPNVARRGALRSLF